MLSQTKEENTLSSEKIKQLLEVDLKNTIDYKIFQYSESFERRLGLDKDDLRSHVMLALWKSLLTWNKAGGANIKTYASNIIGNVFKTLHKKSMLTKNNSLSYYDDVLNAPTSEPEYFVDHDTTDKLLSNRELMIALVTTKKTLNKKVAVLLVNGNTLEEIVKATGAAQAEVIKIIKSIDKELKQHATKKTYV